MPLVRRRLGDREPTGEGTDNPTFQARRRITSGLHVTSVRNPRHIDDFHTDSAFVLFQLGRYVRDGSSHRSQAIQTIQNCASLYLESCQDNNRFYLGCHHISSSGTSLLAPKQSSLLPTTH
jgi:hypothetical protein